MRRAISLETRELSEREQQATLLARARAYVDDYHFGRGAGSLRAIATGAHVNGVRAR